MRVPILIPGFFPRQLYFGSIYRTFAVEIPPTYLEQATDRANWHEYFAFALNLQTQSACMIHAFADRPAFTEYVYINHPTIAYLGRLNQ